MRRLVPLLFLLVLVLPAPAAEYRCAPTRPDADGPFYRPGAPLRDAVGSGYLLFGTVKSAVDCRPLPGARIEIGLNGPAGLAATLPSG